MTALMELFAGASDQETSAILNAFPLGMSLCAIPGGRILFSNRVFESMFGYPRGQFETCGQFIDATSLNEKQREQRQLLWKHFPPTCEDQGISGISDIEIDVIRADGGICTVMHTGVMIPARGVGIAIYKDVSEFKRENRLLRRYAYFDPLTNLPNRRAMQERWLEARQQGEDARMALLVIDLDNFKKVNDGYGHDAGDLTLQAIADRLRQAVREADLVCRIGGDEFAIWIPAPEQPEILTAICDRILHAVKRPIELPWTTVRLSASIGGAIYPEHGADARQLFQRADQAMYQIKKSGKSGWRWWSQDAANQSVAELPANLPDPAASDR